MYDKKYRPSSFSKFIGNDIVIESLEKMLKQKDRGHTYLFSGERGCGKTTLARIIAKKIGANKNSIKLFNTANDRGIDKMRNIIDSARYKDITGSPKVFIMDEAHQITNDAQQSLLEITEEPPEHVYFIFCTTNPEKMKKTLKDRCVKYELKPLGIQESRDLLKYVIKKEKLKLKNKFIDLIIKYSDGLPRRLVNNLFECKDLNYKKAKILLENRIEDVSEEAINLCRAIMNMDNIDWKDLMKIVDGMEKNNNPENIRHMMYVYFASVLKNSKTLKNAVTHIAILDTIEEPLPDGRLGKSGLIHMIGKIIVGLYDNT